MQAKLIRPKPRVVVEHREAELFCEELLDVARFCAVDSEWYDFDKNKAQPYNGLSFCWTFCWREESGELQLAYLHNYAESSGNVYAMRKWWTSEEHIKTLHNAPVDAHILGNHGIVGKSFRVDTMVMDYLLDESGRENMHDLKSCARDFLGFDRKPFAQVFGTRKLRKDGKPYASGQLIVPSLVDVLYDPREEHYEGTSIPKKIINYACNDAYDGLLLSEVYEEKLRKIPWRTGTYYDYFWSFESRITELFTKIERRGMPLDLDQLRAMEEVATKQLEDHRATIVRLTGIPINPGSDKQIGALLFGTPDNPYHVKKGPNCKVPFTIRGLGLMPQGFTDTGAPSTNADSLKRLRRLAMEEGDKELEELLTALLNYSAVQTQLSTFFRGLREKQINGKIHTRINQIGTTSGRASSSGPNLQNISTGEKDIFGLRDCFIAPPGRVMVVADFAQLEYRLLAHFSRDPALIRAFKEDLDLHSLTAYGNVPKIKKAVDEKFNGPTREALKWVKDEFDDERKKSKTLNFEIIYGVGHKKLADQLNIPERTAKAMIDGWFSTYAGVGVWMRRLLAKARRDGYVKTILGRYRRPIMEKLNSDKYGERGAEERTIVNGVIQGSAADVCETAMLKLDAHPELNAFKYEMIMQVHDEVVGTTPLGTHKQVAKLVQDTMTNPFRNQLLVDLPVSVGYGPCWSLAKH